MRVLIETHGGGQRSAEREVTGSADIETLLGELAGHADATLSLGLSPVSDDVEVIVGITPNGYLLTRCHDGDYQQLVGAPDASGEIDLKLGGQPTPTPRRWLVARTEVLRVLDRYVRDSTFPDGLSWEQP